jgi:hypothetical protein
MRKALLFITVFLLLASMGMAGCAPAPTPAPELKPPVIKLERVEIAHYWPFYLETKERRGSPLDLAFIFAIENPNDFKVMLDHFKFTVAFEGFDVNTVNVYEDSYIPAKTTNYLRVHASFDAFTTLLSLLVTGGFKLQEKGVKAPDQVKNWWEGIQDFAFPIQVKEGAATFKSDYGDSIVAFEGTFP